MPESTLALSLTDLQAEVGQYLGYGRTFASMTAAQQAQVTAVISAGLRQFYFPPMMPGQNVAHKWSFLSPVTTLSTVASQQVYDLPDDFGGMDGEMTYDPSQCVMFTIERVGEGRVRALQQTSALLTGRPQKVAVGPKKADGASGQRFQATFWPTPDAAYVLAYRYNVLPSALGTSNPYPYGGMAHAETILESCLAVAESRINDTADIHRQQFLDRLAASETVDARDFRPEALGYNGDRSDGRHEGAWGFWRHSFDNTVTVKGVVPS